MASGETDVHDRVMLEIVRHLSRHFRKESPIVNVLVSLANDFAAETAGSGGADAVSPELTASMRMFMPLFFAQLRASLCTDAPELAKQERLLVRHADLFGAVADLCKVWRLATACRGVARPESVRVSQRRATTTET